MAVQLCEIHECLLERDYRYINVVKFYCPQCRKEAFDKFLTQPTPRQEKE
jgi:hypothetical protein